MNFESFLKQMPDCPGSGTFPIIKGEGGFSYINHGLKEFVGPDVSPSTVINQPDFPKVLIISAAGAVGKSTLGKQMAYRKQAPLWDLAQTSAVGENSLTGQLTNSFGFGKVGEVNAKLASGQLFLIIDALDEARVKANEAGFEAFIQNIAEIAKSTKGVAFVLLGRTQTAETTWLLLNEAGVSASLFSIQPFTRQQAEQYIESRIQCLDANAAKRINDHKQPFIEARDLILLNLEHAVSGGSSAIKDEAVREFLGYAPVLETVAVFLAKEGNYQEFITSLRILGKENYQVDRPLAVLEHVITRLLEREQKQKLQHNIKPALEKLVADTGWKAWDTLYSPTEQRIRLLGRILGRSFDACPSMPASVRARYEEGLKTWLPEHPFLRDGALPANKVFESYLFAVAMREYLTPLSGYVEAKIAARDYKPSRLLADFYILLGEQSGETIMAERQIGFLYDSILAGETDSLRVHMSIESSNDDIEGEGEFELVYALSEKGKQSKSEIKKFKLVQEQGSISFRYQVKEAEVITQGAVVLGGVVDDFEIGPGVHIQCETLKILSTGLVVRGSSTKNGEEPDIVILDANKCESNVSQKPVIRGGVLSVIWPGAEAYPWNEFFTESSANGIEDVQMQGIYRRLVRIVTSLRSHSKGRLARFRGKVEHRRVLKDQMGQALLSKILEDGILTLENDFYFWVPERANLLLRASWHDLHHMRVTPEIREYISNFVAENLKLFKNSK